MKKATRQLVLAAALVLALAAVSANAADPIAHWTFDEGSGTTAYDSAGGNDGTVYGAQWVPGKVGSGALSFNGTDNYVNLDSHIANFASLSTGTITAWIDNKAPAGVPGGIILMASDSGDSDSTLYLAMLEDQRLKVRISENGSSSLYWISNNPVSSDWHHFAFATNALGNRMYLDGQLMTGSYTVGSLTTNAFFNRVHDLDSLRIGEHWVNNQVQSPWNGMIDDVRIYNYALSQQEISTLAVPEPATLMLLGLGGLMLRRKR